MRLEKVDLIEFAELVSEYADVVKNTEENEKMLEDINNELEKFTSQMTDVRKREDELYERLSKKYNTTTDDVKQHFKNLHKLYK